MGNKTVADALGHLREVATMFARGELLVERNWSLDPRYCNAKNIASWITAVLDAHARQSRLLEALRDARHAQDAQAALQGLTTAARAFMTFGGEQRSEARSALVLEALAIADAMGRAREDRASVRPGPLGRTLGCDVTRRVLLTGQVYGRRFEFAAATTSGPPGVLRVGVLFWTRADAEASPPFELSVPLSRVEVRALIDGLAMMHGSVEPAEEPVEAAPHAVKLSGARLVPGHPLTVQIAGTHGEFKFTLHACTRCGAVIWPTEPFMGDGDGNGQRFAHPRCTRESP